jgi:hypothetical protein
MIRCACSFFGKKAGALLSASPADFPHQREDRNVNQIQGSLIAWLFMTGVTRKHPEFWEGNLRVTPVVLFFILNQPVVSMQNPKGMPYSAELILHSYVTFIAAKWQHVLFGKKRLRRSQFPPADSLPIRGALVEKA